MAPAGRARGERKNILEFLGPPLLFMAQPFPGPAPCRLFWENTLNVSHAAAGGSIPVKKSPDIKNIKKAYTGEKQ
jgi:hypothetical protein